MVFFGLKLHTCRSLTRLALKHQLFTMLMVISVLYCLTVIATIRKVSLVHKMMSASHNIFAKEDKHDAFLKSFKVTNISWPFAPEDLLYGHIDDMKIEDEGEDSQLVRKKQNTVRRIMKKDVLHLMRTPSQLDRNKHYEVKAKSNTKHEQINDLIKSRLYQNGFKFMRKENNVDIDEIQPKNNIILKSKTTEDEEIDNSNDIRRAKEIEKNVTYFNVKFPSYVEYGASGDPGNYSMISPPFLVFKNAYNNILPKSISHYKITSFVYYGSKLELN